MARLRTAIATSAGGVVYRGRWPDVDVALCGRLATGLWGLPKGTPNRGEDLIETALREVREETGLDARVVAPLGEISYWFASRGVRYHKVVHFYLMEAVGGDVASHDREYDVVRWFSLAEALAHVSHENEAEVLRRAADQIERQGGASPKPGRGSGE